LLREIEGVEFNAAKWVLFLVEQTRIIVVVFLSSSLMSMWCESLGNEQRQLSLSEANRSSKPLINLKVIDQVTEELVLRPFDYHDKHSKSSIKAYRNRHRAVRPQNARVLWVISVQTTRASQNASR